VLEQALDGFLLGDHEAEVRRLREAKLTALGSLVGGVAHDLRNPLLAMHGAIVLLSRHTVGDDKSATALRMLDREIQTCQRIVTDLLDLAGERSPERETVALRAMVDEVAALATRGAGRSDVRVENDVPGDVTVSADPGQLRRVLSNLVQNGIEAMPADRAGAVRVTTVVDAGLCTITIADDGAGMPDDVRRRMFEPLYTTKRKGTGLGMAIVARIVERHDGTIAIDSVVGQGTVVTVRLPLTAPPRR
jgi:signal transduction histidine kinase